MSAAKSVPTAKALRWGHDLRTTEGNEAFAREYYERQRIARDFFSTDFEDARLLLDKIDGLIISVLTDLANDDDMKETVFEIAKIAHAAYCLRSLVPKVGDTHVEPSAGDVAEAARPEVDIRGLAGALQSKARPQ